MYVIIMDVKNLLISFFEIFDDFYVTESLRLNFIRNFWSIFRIYVVNVQVKVRGGGRSCIS